ncbi:MAG: methylenetetrahydrofolate reductase [Myxococcota bacterium]|nr:methylenetetrahydrofolate reductase [Myxococcota bacterium]
MRVTDLFEEKRDKPIISFEFSRPKGEKAAAKLDKALATLKTVNPDYVSVTFGAGGSTRDGSFELIEKLKTEFGFCVVAYLAGIGLGPDDLCAVMDRFNGLGIETVFVVRGDAPTWEETYDPHPESMKYASDMISFIKERYDVCLGGAAYPEGHIQAESKDKDLSYAKLKQDLGAEYLVAQYFYDNQYFFDFMERCQQIGITVPVVPGIMPIYSVKLMASLASICGATITDQVRNGLSELPSDDKKAVSQFGIQFTTEQCRGLLRRGVRGLHFYTMNRAKSVSKIIETLRGEGLL